MKLADLIYLYLDLYSYWQLNLRAALAAACCLARKENRADPSQTRSFAVVTNSGPGVEHVAVCNLRSRACSFLGMRRGLKDRGPRSMGAYNESRLRGAPVPSARRKSATVRMPTQPPSSPAAPVYGSNKIQSGEIVELHSGVKGMAWKMITSELCFLVEIMPLTRVWWERRCGAQTCRSEVSGMRLRWVWRIFAQSRNVLRVADEIKYMLETIFYQNIYLYIKSSSIF